MVYTGKVPKCPRGGNRHRDSGRIGEEGLQCRGPQEVCGCHTALGLPLCLLAFGTIASAQIRTGAVLTWDKDSTRGPEGIQPEADCFLSSLPLHAGGEQRSDRASRFGQQLCLEERLSARHLLIAGGLNSWMGWKLVM